MQVQADPGKSYVKPSRSSAVDIRIAAPQPVPVSYTVAAFVATVLAGAAFFLARNRPWQRLRKPAPPAERAGEEDETFAADRSAGSSPREPGLRVDAAPPERRRLRRRRPRHRARPAARRRDRALVLGDDSRTSGRTGDDGAFAFEASTPGEWRARSPPTATSPSGSP